MAAYDGVDYGVSLALVSGTQRGEGCHFYGSETGVNPSPQFILTAFADNPTNEQKYWVSRRVDIRDAPEALGAYGMITILGKF